MKPVTPAVCNPTLTSYIKTFSFSFFKKQTKMESDKPETTSKVAVIGGGLVSLLDP